MAIVPRAQWWKDEYKKASDEIVKKVGRKGRKKRYKTVSKPAPCNDICGYARRNGAFGKATVRGYSVIVWHHSETVNQAPNLVSMALFHRRKHFGDTAYHFMIKRNDAGQWTIYQGTPLGYVGSHARHYNFFPETATGSLGIMVAGDFDRQYPDKGLMKTMTQLQDWLVKKYNIRDIRTHRDGPLAVNDGHGCPGKHLLPFIQQLHNRAR